LTALPTGDLVTVITPVHNEAAVLDETAATILGQDWPEIEFLFVDGRSTDGSRERLEALAASDARIRVLDNPAGDLASALQIGLAAARGGYVAKLDAHTYFPPGYVRLGVERLRRGGAAWVSGPPVPFGIDAGSRRVAGVLGTWLGVGGSSKWARSGAGDEDEERELDTGVFSGVWETAGLRRHGGWNPEWPVNEDAELASRYLAAGETIVCVPAMAARYVPRSTLRGLARQYWRYGFYRAKTAERHPGSLRRSALLAPGLAAALVVFVAGGRLGRRLAGPGLAAYLGVAGFTAAGLREDLGGPAGAASAVPVYATMHLAWGFGFLAGCARFGLPADLRSRAATHDG
jgi:glycosyltransferase involved in cell wall biosynthesis